MQNSRAEEGKALTADRLGAAYQTLVEKYHAGAAVGDELIDIEWARIPQFYSSFYVYVI